MGLKTGLILTVVAVGFVVAARIMNSGDDHDATAPVSQHSTPIVAAPVVARADTAEACRQLDFNRLMHDDNSDIHREVVQQFVGNIIGSNSTPNGVTVEVEGVKGTGGRCQAKTTIKCEMRNGTLTFISDEDDGYIPC
jgi:hypothetical protein